MKRCMISTSLLFFSVLLAACGTPESAVQTAIAQTEEVLPTETPTIALTNTPKATNTTVPTSTSEPTETPQPAIEDRIIGTWSGAMTNTNGDKLPAIWTFLDGGVMVVEIPILEASYGATWYADGNRIYITTELDPDNETYRDVEFVNDDLMILTKDEGNISETWIREESDAN